MSSAGSQQFAAQTASVANSKYKSP